MLTFKSLSDLREYLETRKKMASRQIPLTERKSHVSGFANGMEFAFDESIKALDAFIESQKAQETSA